MDFSDKRVAIGSVCMIILFVTWRGVGVKNAAPRPAQSSGPTLKVATWNLAAINNNPFEYWITHTDDAYNKLMIDVQDFIAAPGDKDVAVSQVFTETMFSELHASMKQEGWPGIDETKARWDSDFKNRKIISGFMKDKTLGDKRLASMPDRTTNTILTTNGPVFRPTVINCYEGHFANINDWWLAWRKFLFETSVSVKGKTGAVSDKRVLSLLQPIKSAKYPALTAEEEKISIPLQTMAGAIFDAILFHIVSTVSGTKWQELRTGMCNALNRKKTEHTLGIIKNTYGNSDIIFLQEVAAQFIENAKVDVGLRDYAVISPTKLGKRDQNSVIMLNKALFDVHSIVEVSDMVQAQFGGAKVPVATGDILAITLIDRKGNKYMLASFHGDTNGLATIPVVNAVHKTHGELGGELRLIFGLDANTYEHATPGKTQDVLEFARSYVGNAMTSVWGDTPDPTDHTTFNARTYLQPQLNKAARKSELVQKGDVNPKDFILYYKKDFTTKNKVKDNTGKKEFVEQMVFPTLQFPSDHGILSAVLKKEF